MYYQMEFAGLQVTVCRKKIKNLNLAVCPPNGHVRVSAPYWVAESRIRDFILSRMGWIRQRQERLKARPLPQELKFEDGERHLLWGLAYPLRLHPQARNGQALLADGQLHVYTRGGAEAEKVSRLLDGWYTAQLMDAALGQLEKWRSLLALEPVSLAVRKMKSRWGSCIPLKRKVTLNLQLAKRPPQCLEAVLVHELGHFFAQNHGPEFKNFMDRHYPNWKEVDGLLKSMPL